MTKAGRYVFIAHHFRGDGRKYADLLAWILKRYNIRTMFGENLEGERISEGVQARIKSAGVVLVLFTRDVKVGEDTWLPSTWVIQEVTWATAHHVPCVLVVEEGVKFDGGIAGDLEQISFSPGEFLSGALLERIVNQVQAMVAGVVVPEAVPQENLSDRVWRLVLEAREQGSAGTFNEVLRLSEEALALDPTAWPATINKGVALVKRGQLNSAKQVFSDVLEGFADNEQAKAMAYHNLGWLEEVRSAGGADVKSLLKQVKYYEKALAVKHSAAHTRASLLQCKVILGELSDAKTLLMQSLNYRGFLKALRYETENKGYQGHQILRQLPESEWLYPILFPKWEAGDDNYGSEN